MFIDLSEKLMISLNPDVSSYIEFANLPFI